MKRLTIRATVALALGLGLTLALLLGLNKVEGLAMEGLPTVKAAPTATTRYVATSGTDTNNDCTNSGNPCRTIQHAVDNAGAGDDILVGAGTYAGVQTRGGESQVVYISKTLTLRGGYDTTFVAWDPDTYSTTVDANGRGRAIYALGAPTAYITLTLEGLQITNGTGDHGGGAYAARTYLTLKNCRIFSNTSSSRGGGIYLSAFGMLMDNQIYDNTSEDGGGLYLSFGRFTVMGNQIYDNVASASSGGLCLEHSADARLVENQIYSNTASMNGGGVLILDSDRATLSGNHIHGNKAKYGGGVRIAAYNATLTGNRISDNEAGANGGGVSGSGAGGTLSGNWIYSNTASLGGGGVYFLQDGGTLSGNWIYSNTVGTNGGGIYVGGDNNTLSGNWIYGNTAGHAGGGVIIIHCENASLVNNVIVENKLTGSGDGAGINVYSSDARLLHTTIARNYGGGGSGISVGHTGSDYSTVALTNTILVSHTRGIYITPGDTTTLKTTLWGSGAWANGDEWGGSGTIITETDLYGAPAFTGPDNADYHITFDSPARDAAADAGVVDDIDGDSRLFDAQPDVGADEYACHVRLNGTPYATVQDAVDAAIDDDLVMVAGTCRGVQTRGPLATQQTAYVTESITVRGGYDADFSAWDPDTYPTTLDAQGKGRVIHMTGDITPTLEGLRLTHGSVTGAGSGVYSADAHPVISGCQIYSNTTVTSGAGMYLSGGDGALLMYNDIYSNTAGNSTGGIYFHSCNSARSVGNTVRDNSALFSGGFYIQDSADIVLVNTMVVENRITKVWGAGLRIRNAQVRLLHTTIARNSGGSGEGIYVSHDAAVWMTNTIMVSHTVGVRVDTGSVALEATLWGEGAWANVTDTVGSGITTGTVNSRGNPGFVDYAGGDYHINVASEAIDAGVDIGVTTDIDGDARPWPAGGGYDIGADEIQYLSIHLPLVLRND